ncbi:DUF503 domain-containing protein [Anaerococcus sp. NML200537]|uniref:DUF503 domain-containing protein n=1 Tax=Anaerococcus sp. NML200537 TaxID=2954485 RepID=UPI0022375E0D|nr:DUF503 domain-containing protein [Anaerococcus sp. NML200537]MCW6702584.1 DUF503 domain-containing protein [Anaerococcus sp. NML200537]
MYVYLLEIKFVIFDAFSLKDKRRTVRSILDYARKNLNISAAEISDLDILNKAHLGFVTISNSNKVARKIIDDLINRIESTYPIEILEKNMERLA